MSNHDHDGGLARDLPLLTRRRLVAGLGLAGLAGTAAVFFGTSGGMAEGNQLATGLDGAQCLKLPGETNGPFPADGSNSKDGQTVNVLTQNGVIRDDLRPSFNGLSGQALGVPLTLDITLVNVAAACAPLAGHAIYLWHCDAEGLYSLYNVADQNWLRGVVLTDAQGRARLTTILPGCYDGRWPHIHFEVYASAEAAASGAEPLLTSQFALPVEPLVQVYASDPRYPTSQSNLARLSLAADMVFGDNTAEQIAAQTLAMTGDLTAGFGASGQVGVLA
jgi:protocatechuate 3,4-dioxygenase beta subunit